MGTLISTLIAIALVLVFALVINLLAIKLKNGNRY